MTTLVFAILAFGVFTIGGAIGVIMGLEIALYGMRKVKKDERITAAAARDSFSHCIDAYLATREYSEYDESMGVPAYERDRLTAFVDFLMTKAEERSITQ